jgi:magnesium-transporting ATPase (P-type)
MEQWYRSSWNKVVKDLGSDIYKGLDEQEVQLRRKNYGSNKIQYESYNIYFGIGKLLLQLWFTAALANVYILFTEAQKAAAIMVLTVTLFGMLIQISIGIKRYKRLTRVKLRNKAPVRVLRDGINSIIKTEEIVIGDIIMLKKDSLVPADIRIIESEKLFVMESSITGETSAVEKYSTKIDEEISNIANIKNMLFRSSVVTHGSTLGIVVAVGMNTVDSITIKAMNKTTFEEDTVLKKINRVSNIHILVIFAITVIFTLGTVLMGRANAKLLKEIFFSASFYNSVICGVLIFSLIKIYIQNDAIQLLKTSTIFKLPQIGILVMDKFGTVSGKNITLAEIYTDGSSYFPTLGRNEWSINLDRIFQSLVLCNSYSEFSKDSGEVYNYIIDKELKVYIEDGLKYEIEEGKYKRLFVNSYDNDRRLMTYVYKVEDKYRAYTKGMLDAISDRCRYIMKDGIEVEFTNEDLEEIKHKAVMLESKGLNILAVAYRNFTYEPTPVENVESNMVFVGLVALKNSLREEASQYIKELRMNHIRPVFFTEETKLSAFTWGKSLGIVKNINEVLSGVEMDNMSQDEYENYCHKIGIYSKLTPRNKAQVIKTYSGKGVLTAYVCKGTEDLAPAVNADFNIVKGENIRNFINISDISIKNNLLKNLLTVIEKVKVYITKLNKVNEFILTYLCSQFLLTLFVGFLYAEDIYRYGNIIWLAFFNLPLMITVILIDDRRKIKKEDNLELFNIKEVKPDILKAYKIALVLVVLTLILQSLLKVFAAIEVNLYFIFNAVLLAALNLYRINNKKALSWSSLVYGLIIIFNLVLIFIMNK